MKLLQSVLLCVMLILASNSAIGDCHAQSPDAQSPDVKHPISGEDREKLTESLRKSEEVLSEKLLDGEAKRVGLLSQRGDVLFFLGEFKKAVADYEEMVDLDPQQGNSHWRRGIARFYAGQAKEAAQQFEAYHSFDDIDRENGIWRYFSQYRAYGPKKAKEGLLKYRKTDREPFPDVYRLFSGDTTPKKILAAIDAAETSKDEREKRLFYAQLYIGLNHAVEGHNTEAIVHLRESTANSWGRGAGYGPQYMWHVGRVHLDLLLEKLKKTDNKPVSRKDSSDGSAQSPQPVDGR